MAARPAALVLVAVTTATLAACASAHPDKSSTGGSAPPIATSPASPPRSSAAPPGAPPTATPPGTGSGTAGCPRDLVVPTADLSHRFCVANGGTVTILAPTNQAQGWGPFETTGNSLATATAGPPVGVSGKVIAVFKAVAPGSSVVSSAHRNCPVPSGGVACNSIVIWQVTVTVK